MIVDQQTPLLGVTDQGGTEVVTRIGKSNVRGNTLPIVPLALMKSDQGGSDYNLYGYEVPEEGDWTYWDADGRNPSPLGREPSVSCSPIRLCITSFLPMGSQAS